MSVYGLCFMAHIIPYHSYFVHNNKPKNEPKPGCLA